MKIKESKFPKTYILGGITFSIIFLAIFIYSIFFMDDIKDKFLLSIVFGPLTIFSIVLTILISIWKITYNNDGTLTYRNYFGKCKTYRYSELESYYISSNKTDYYVKGRKVFTISYFITNNDYLDDYIKNGEVEEITIESNEEIKDTNIYSKQPIMFLIVGLLFLIAGSLMVLLVVIGYFIDRSNVPFIVFCVMAIISVGVFVSGVYFLMLFFIWKVSYHKETFTYRNWFGLKRTYRYDEVIADTNDPTKKYFYCNGKKILVIRYFVTYPNELLSHIKKKVSKVKTIYKKSNVKYSVRSEIKSKNVLISSKLVVYRPLCLVIIVILAFMYGFNNNKPIEEIVDLLCILGSIVIVLFIILILILNWKISICDDGTFIYRNMFGVSVIYQMRDVEIKKSKKNFMVFYKGKKIFTLPKIASNREEVEKRLIRRR